MPRRIAPSECQAAPNSVLTKLLVGLAALARSRRHVARQAELGVARVERKLSGLPVSPIRISEPLQVRAAGEVEADEGNLARARRDVADVRSACPRGRATWRAPAWRPHEHARARAAPATIAGPVRKPCAMKSRRDDRRLVALVPDGLVETQRARALLVRMIHALTPLLNQRRAAAEHGAARRFHDRPAPPVGLAPVGPATSLLMTESSSSSRIVRRRFVADPTRDRCCLPLVEQRSR